MDLSFKYKAYCHAMEFESVYDYSEHYKVNGNPVVWRYMGLDKFESLLKSKAMFFAKPSKFIDPLEGSYSMWDIEKIKDTYEFTHETSREYMKKIQEFSAISCWHMNEHESAGMWDLYLNSKDGIAIKSNYNDLINSIKDLKYKVFDGVVQYIDFRKEMTSKNIYDTLFYKRKSFSHENELRLLVIASRIDEKWLERLFDSQDIPCDEWEERMDKLENQSYNFASEAGDFVSCNLDRLIDAIYISPKSSIEFVNAVKATAEKYDLSKKVIQSDLYKDYIY